MSKANDGIKVFASVTAELGNGVTLERFEEAFAEFMDNWADSYASNVSEIKE